MAEMYDKMGKHGWLIFFYRFMTLYGPMFYLGIDRHAQKVF